MPSSHYAAEGHLSPFPQELEGKTDLKIQLLNWEGKRSTCWLLLANRGWKTEILCLFRDIPMVYFGALMRSRAKLRAAQMDTGKKQDQEGSAVTKKGQGLSLVPMCVPC